VPGSPQPSSEALDETKLSVRREKLRPKRTFAQAWFTP
jgi:hypothetical protein